MLLLCWVCGCADDVEKKVKFIKSTAQKIDDLTDKIDNIAHIVEDDANKVEALIDKVKDKIFNIVEQLWADHFELGKALDRHKSNKFKYKS